MGRRANPSDSPLRQMRQELGWSLTKLAERIGYSKGYLSMVESGVKRPTRQLIEAYERSLRLPAGALSGTIAGREKWEFGKGMLEDQPSAESEYDQLTKLSANPSQARLVVGAWAVSALALELITAASNKPPSGKGEILISSRNERHAGYLTRWPWWFASLRKALDRGWNVVLLRLRDNKGSSLAALIRDDPSQSPSSGGSIHEYHYSKGYARAAAPHFMAIVPGQGALMLFRTFQPLLPDTGFFFTSEEHVEILCKYFSILKSHTMESAE